MTTGIEGRGFAAALFDVLPDPVVVLGPDATLVWANQAAVEARLLGVDGSVVPMSLTFVDLVTDQAVQGIVVAASDITALVEARTELHHLANHDDLTGLPNRSNLLRRVGEVLAREPADPHTLIFGDVDGLKAVNDHHGHQAGDALLAEVAARLRGVMRAGDFVARLSGDEFVVMIPTDDPKAAADLQRRIEVALEPPARLPDGTLVRTSMSLGAASTRPGVSAEEVLAVADAAMYAAKRSRTGSA
jgi:diguanylate cyclase (GGDEF)-like protein